MCQVDHGARCTILVLLDDTKLIGYQIAHDFIGHRGNFVMTNRQYLSEGARRIGWRVSHLLCNLEATLLEAPIISLQLLRRPWSILPHRNLVLYSCLSQSFCCPCVNIPFLKMGQHGCQKDPNPDAQVICEVKARREVGKVQFDKLWRDGSPKWVQCKGVDARGGRG